MTDRVGQQLGNYRLTHLLGQGGFAEVYLGEHVFLGTIIAIKVLHTQVAPEDMAQFQQEARILAGLKHPHIVNILDFGIEERIPYLMMSYAPHGTLRTRHPKGTVLPVATVVSYVKQVTQALQYAHERKIVHRDIKPENMLIGEQNEILLSDFGIALVTQSSRYQSTQDMAGTMAYSAPEQIQGKPRPASDQYALGIVVYEWLSGDRPFHGSFTELVGQHLTVPPPSLREKLPLLSPALVEVVMRALAKDPHQRFSSIHAFATALEQASQGNLPTERARPIPLSSPLPPLSSTSTSLPITATVPTEPPNTLMMQTHHAHEDRRRSGRTRFNLLRFWRRRNREWYFSGQEQGEEVRLVIRKHWWFLVQPALPLIGCTLGLLVVFWAAIDRPGFGPIWYLLEVTAFIGMLLAAVWFAYKGLITRWHETYIITNRRIINARGLLKPTRQQMALGEVEQVGLEINRILGLFFGFGTIHVYLDGGDFYIRDVPKPRKVRNAIIGITEEIAVAFRKKDAP